MKKKVLMSLMSLIMAGSLVACGGSGDTKKSSAPNKRKSAVSSTKSVTSTVSTAKTSETPSANGEALRLVNGKIEIDKQLKDLAEKYKAETGQEVIVESLGGGVDIQATVKGYYQAGNMPDMFVIGGKGDYSSWKGLVADLSDCAFVKDTDLAFKDDETGEVVGFPYAVEGYGITYNADILKKAGIDPKKLVNYKAYEEAFKTLDAKKDELGIQAVISMAAESGQMYWSTGNHLFGYYISGGIRRDNKDLFKKFMKGEFDDARLAQFGKFFKLMTKYADPQVLISGTYDDQLALWAKGKAAFITQGNWVDTSFGDYNIKFDAGIAPLAFTEGDMPGILADSPSWWVAFKDGKHVDAVKKFFDWMASSDVARKAMVEDMGMVSPYKSVKNKPTLPLAKSVSGYLQSGDIYAWDWSNMPEGIAMQYTGSVFESYAKGEINNDKFVELLKAQVNECIAAQQ